MLTIDDCLQNNSDEVLCAAAVAGDRISEEILVMRYNRLVRVCARPFFLVGGDSEDLIQEGMFGLLNAIREFDPARDTSFHTFAEVCIRNRIRSVVVAATRGKHAPLNDSVSLGSQSFAQNNDFSSSVQDNPEELLIGREVYLERLGNLRCQLSGFESRVLDLYLQRLSYQEIAGELCRPPKSVDNAVQRIRKKVAQHFSSGVISES